MQTEQTSKITNEQKDFTFVKKRKFERKGVKNNNLSVLCLQTFAV